MQDILINWAPQETRVAVVENGAIQELHVERALERGLVGNIYAGRVARVLPGMQSAFIDIGLERAAFLHVADLQAGGHGPRGEHGNGNGAADADRAPRLRRPDADRAGHQGPDRHEGRAAVDADQHRRAAARLPAAGRSHRHLAEDRLARAARAAARAHERAGPGRRAGAAPSGGGFILRTNADDATDDELADDIRYLRKTWTALRERGFKSPPGTLLHQDLSLAERVLRDLVDEQTQSIRIDSKLQFETLTQFGRDYTPTSVASSSITPASGRSSTSTTSTRRSRGRSSAGST